MSAATETPDERRIPPRRWRPSRILWLLLAAFLAIQLVPYGRDHTNPPITGEPSWDSATTRALVGTACFDCHSNETNWYWYTNIAPFSWLVQHDVEDGRATLNFSEWNRPQGGAGDVADVIRGGSMPPWYYSAVHWAARLSTKEKAELIAGLQRTFQASPPIGG
jgi:hypothetical protein